MTWTINQMNADGVHTVEEVDLLLTDDEEVEVDLSEEG